MPDVDTDFSNRDREKMVEFCQYKYGYEKVAQIVTFQTLGVKRIIKAVGKVLGMPYAETDLLSKEVPNEIIDENGDAKKVETLSQLKSVEFFKNKIEDNEIVAQLFEYGAVLDGLPASTGKHAAGVIIGRVPLDNIVALMEVDGVLVTQFEKMNSEDIGLLKMDFLGLRNEDIIQNTVELIEKHTGKKIDIDTIPLDDSLTFDLLQNANTSNVFQFEGSGMKDLLIKLHPTRFSQLADVTSLFRPGPMAFIPNYIEGARHPETIHYFNDIFKEVTEETNGILVYQEQIMTLVQKMAGFSLGQADLLRRGIGKKIAHYLTDGRVQFVKGSKELNNVPEEISEQIYDTIVTFANYGFNKSHAVAYALISYQTAYLKAHYPVYYMTACLNINSDNPDKLASTLAECKNMGLEILAPAFGISEYDFTVEGQKKIRYGLGAIKGVSNKDFADALQNTDKTDFQSIIMSLPADILRRNQLEYCIYAGLFDKYGTRYTLVKELGKLLELAKYQAHLNNLGISNFFNDFKKIDLSENVELPLLQKLQHEKDAIQISLSGHPLDSLRSLYGEEINKLNTANLKDAILELGAENGKGKEAQIPVSCLFVVRGLHKITTKSGQPMGFVQCDDEYGNLEGVTFPKVYEKLYNIINASNDKPVILKGKASLSHINTESEAVCIIVDDIIPVSEVQEKLFIEQSDYTDNIKDIFTNNNGITEVIMIMPDYSIQKMPNRVNLNEKVLAALNTIEYELK